VIPRIALLFVVATLAAGCTAGAATSPEPAPGSSSSGTGSASPSPALATGGGQIEGVAWELDADSISLATPVPGIDADVRFADGQVSGSNGCNRYAGSYELDGDRVAISKLSSTGMSCVQPAQALETAFMDALGRASTFGVTDGSLALGDQDGATVLRFRRVETVPLTGHYWAVTGMAGEGDGLLTPLPLTELVVRFGNEGTVNGTTGCNSYRGSFALDGSAMTITDVASTEKFCDDVAGEMDQEARFHALLPDVASYVVRGDQLELHAQDGLLLVALRPDVTPGVADAA